jgi:hypothetical protein
MKRLNVWMLSAALLSPTMVLAKLPAPTPEEAQQKAAAAEKKALGEEAAKSSLAKAQDRVASRYRAKNPQAPHTIAVVTKAK